MGMNTTLLVCELTRQQLRKRKAKSRPFKGIVRSLGLACILLLLVHLFWPSLVIDQSLITIYSRLF